MARTLSQRIRKIIKQHYGDNLDTFRPDVSYRDGTESFVKALSQVIKGEIKWAYDWECDLAKYGGRPGPLDINIGRRLRDIRLWKEMPLEDVAAKMGVHLTYLDELEQGKLTPCMGIIGDAMNALDATRKEKMYIADEFMDEPTTQEWIWYVIEMYYGRSLWTLRPEVSYEESIEPFVKALMELGPTQQYASSPRPKGPTLGDMVQVEGLECKKVDMPEVVLS